jgi:hypothetical protein
MSVEWVGRATRSCEEGFEMKKLQVETLLDCATRAATVLRKLDASEGTTRFHEFGREIGLISSDERWKPWHRQQIATVLNVVAAVDRLANRDKETLGYARVVGASGMPGKGVSHISRIVVSRPSK